MIGLRAWNVVAAMLAVALAHPSFAGQPSPYLASGGIRVSYESHLTPIRINRMHSWVVRVQDTDGEPIENAEITVTGGMPNHDHGLPTAPRVTRVLEDGGYLVEGMKFHMSGAWQVTVAVTEGGRSESVTFDLDIPAL